MEPPLDQFRQRQALDALLINRVASLYPIAGPRDGLSTASVPMTIQVPFTIVMGVTVFRVFDINQRSQTFSMHYRLRLMWQDCRLLHNCTRVTVPREHPRYGDFWHPSYAFEEQESIGGGLDTEMYTFSPDGLVVLTVERVGTFRCPFDFKELPFDRQRCKLTFTMPIGDSSRAMLVPMPGPKGEQVIVENTLNAEWRIDGADSWTLQPAVVERELWGTYRQLSVLELAFHIERKPRSMVMNFVFPSVLYYLVSWLGLWIDATAVPARAAIGTIPVLIMTNKLSSLIGAMPPISYPVRLENFLVSTLTFIVVQMLEFGVVNYGLRRQRSLKDSQPGKPGRPATETEVSDLVEVRPQPSLVHEIGVRSLRSLQRGQKALQWPDRVALAFGHHTDTHFRWISLVSYTFMSILILFF